MAAMLNAGPSLPDLEDHATKVLKSLPSAEKVTLSTVELLLKAQASVQNRIKFAQFMRVWRGVGVSIRRTITRGRGVAVKGFGTFTRDANGVPAFTLANVQGLKWRPAEAFIPGDITIVQLSYAAIEQRSGAGRDLIVVVLDAVARAMHKYVKTAQDKTMPSKIRGGKPKVQQASFSLVFSTVGELVYGGPGKRNTKKAGFRFDPSVFAEARAYMLNPRLAMQAANGDRPPKVMIMPQGDSDAGSSRRSGSRRSGSGGGGRRPSGSAYDSEDESIASDNTAEAAAALLQVKNRLICNSGLQALRSAKKVLMLMDDSGDGELDSEELMFGLRDFGVLLTPDEVGDVVQQFDTDGSGAITVTDLHLALRGDMAPKRVALVNKAFGSINPYMAQQGEIPVREIMKKYSPYANPFLNKDALPNIDIGQRGAYSEDDVIRSFQSAIDDGDGSVSRAEFLDFYRDISACIESDDYFEEFIRESWGLPKDGKKRQSAPSGASSSSAAGAAAAVPHAAGESAGINPVVLKLKAQVRGRGPKGLVRLGRAFRAVDDDGNRLLDADQFAKVLKGEGFELSNNQLSKVFLHYDDDMSGYVDYVETVKLLAPAIPERRLGFILEAFDKLDKRGDLVLPLSTVTGAYSPADHPSVTLGRDTRDSVFAHLEESLGGAAGGGKVTLDDFERHYIMRSAVIGDDDYFELIMRQVWQLDGTPASAAKAEKEARKRAEPKKKVIKVKPAAERAPFDCGDGWVGNPFTVGHAKWNAETNEMDIVRPGRKAAKALTLPTMPLQSTMRDDALIDPYNPPRNPWVRLKQMLFPRGDVLVFPEMCERLAVSSGNPALMPRMSSKAFAIQAKRLELKNGRSLTPKNAKELTDVVDPNRTSFVELPWLYKQLGLRFGFPAKGEANGVFHRVRKMILENTGREGVKGLVATFKRFDHKGDGTLDRQELTAGLAEYFVGVAADNGTPDEALRLNPRESAHLFQSFDRDGSGTVSIEEFLDGICGRMSDERQQMVDKVFHKLAQAGQFAQNKVGSQEAVEVPLQDIRDKFDCSWWKVVKNGRVAATAVVGDLLSQLEGEGGPGGGVDADEFSRYYQTVSALVHGDLYFEALLRKTWHTGRLASNAVIVSHASRTGSKARGF